MTNRVLYGSTRGQSPQLNFDDVMLTGLAPDGGLYAPDHWPQFDQGDLRALAGAPYTDVAQAVISAFTGETFTTAELQEMIEAAYGRFAHPAVAPLLQMGPDQFMLELHHGPTLAFKDVAMQLLGHLFAKRLTARGRRMTIVAATSGDTGGAAIDAMAGRPGIGICVLHPEGRISEVQRRFMTTVEADNVLNIAVKGTFDDCQALVKDMFADDAFRTEISLGAVNSINWSRIVAQTVYYVTSSLTLSRQGVPVSYCVPTGNFGDIFAGFAAKQMGAPIGRLIVATNENDILYRALNMGAYRPDQVVETQSPSMDIQVSSNFERLLYLASGRDATTTTQMMADLKAGIGFDLDSDIRATIAADFSAYRSGEDETAAKILQVFEATGQLIDPHTAVGLVAADKAMATEDIDGPLVTLSTAHPAKFPDAVERAAGVRPPLPRRCRDLFEQPEQYDVVPNDYNAVTSIIRRRFAAAD